VLLLEGGTLKEARIFFQESRMRIEALEREREEGAQAFGSQREFLFSKWLTTKGVGGGLFIAPTSKEPLQESFIGQVRWTSLEVGRKFLEAGFRPDKFGEGLWKPVDSPDRSHD
jgi:hypothetical protein